MANSIALATAMLPLLDELYKLESLTADLDLPKERIGDFVGANQVKYFKTSMDGLGGYGRDTGFVDGSVTGNWETLTLSIDRGRSFQIDAMDNEETLNMAFGTLAGEFMRTKVVPEMDAIRFAKYASLSNILTTTGATLTKDTIVPAIDQAIAQMDENEVPQSGRILYVTPTNYSLMKTSGALATRFATMTDKVINRNFEVFDEMRIRKVPQTRFYTALDLNDGKTTGQEAGGYAKAAAAADINFMIIHPSAVLQVPKHAMPRVFDPSVNQKADAWKFDYRIYHDCFGYENKRKGIYLHKK
jgi:hypothetical protein